MLKSAINILAPILILIALTISTMAMWNEQLKTNVLIQSGGIDVDVTSYNIVEGDEFNKPWVANCLIDIVDEDEVDTVKISIAITNGYPGYNCTVYFTVMNTGTIPVIGPFYSEVEIPEGLRLVYSPYNALWQLHPGDTLDHRISIEVLQNANEKTTYSVTIVVEYIQWNEAPAEIESTSISGYIFNDIDGDGEWDSNEPPLKDVHVVLPENGNIISSTYTNDNGYYSFKIYPEGQKMYTIEPDILPGYEFTTPSTIMLTVYPGANYPNNNFGMRMKKAETPAVLRVTKEFKETNVNFEKCPANLGTLLKTVNATVVNNQVKSVAPGAFYGVIAIEGQGITSLDIIDKFGNQFNVEDGRDGKVRVYILNKTTMCATVLKEGLDYTYTVNNEINIVTISINLDRPLTVNEVILVYLKFKPAEGLVGSSWNTIDKSFVNEAEVNTNIGNATVSAEIEIVKKN